MGGNCGKLEIKNCNGHMGIDCKEICKKERGKLS